MNTLQCLCVLCVLFWQCAIGNGVVLEWCESLCGKKERQDLSRDIYSLLGVPTRNPKYGVWQILFGLVRGRFGLTCLSQYLKTITIPETNIATENG